MTMYTVHYQMDRCSSRVIVLARDEDDAARQVRATWPRAAVITVTRSTKVERGNINWLHHR